MECKNCDYFNDGRIVHKLVVGMFRVPQEVLSIYCLHCGNLMYGYCRNATQIPIKPIGGAKND
jgi:hypothetical protein